MADTTDRLRASASEPALERMAALPNGEFTLAMPARRPRWERVQVNARVRVEIEHVLQQFVRAHDTTVQSCVDLALEEFLTARGYPPGELSGYPVGEAPCPPVVALGYGAGASTEPGSPDEIQRAIGAP